MDINYTHCGDHSLIYTNVELSYHTLKTNTLFYVHYTSIFFFFFEKRPFKRLLFARQFLHLNVTSLHLASPPVMPSPQSPSQHSKEALACSGNWVEWTKNQLNQLFCSQKRTLSFRSGQTA